ncbi:TlpA family protein disulfide reductase [bacterium]|nr:MAG: TlpA family protein disulfide reductase [bacterium]
MMLPARCVRALLSIFVAAGLLFVGCSSPSENQPTAVAGGSDEPATVFEVPSDGVTLRFVDAPASVGPLTMQTIDGELLEMSDLRGKVVLVNFWATWCGPCREEIPYLASLTERYPEHLVVIGVSEDAGGVDMVEAFADQYGVNYPIVMSTPEIKRAFPGVFALPTSFVVDPDGQMVQTHVGLISPVILEQETRYLSSLSNNATVETVAASSQIRLANAAQATEIPGVDLSVLTPDQREEALRRLNADGCPCGCQLTLAQCRINDSSCGISPPIVEQLVAEIAAGN